MRALKQTQQGCCIQEWMGLCGGKSDTLYMFPRVRAITADRWPPLATFSHAALIYLILHPYMDASWDQSPPTQQSVCGQERLRLAKNGAVCSYSDSIIYSSFSGQPSTVKCLHFPLTPDRRIRTPLLAQLDTWQMLSAHNSRQPIHITHFSPCSPSST
jgi:hypothetical protein